MNLKYLYTILPLLIFVTGLNAQTQFCFKGAKIATKSGETALSYTLEELGESLVVRFSTRPLVNAYAYLITDENNNIINVNKNNFVDIATLGAGKYRVWSFSYIGDILAEAGKNAASTQLASFCAELSANFVSLEIIDPNKPMIDSSDFFKTVAQAIGRNNLLQIFQRGLERANLGPDLIVEGPLTVFAPVNNAFAKIPNAELEALFDDTRGALKTTMLNHVVKGNFAAEDLKNGQVLTANSGMELNVTINDDGVFINGAKVIITNIYAKNGVIHLIDTVIR